MQYQIAIEKQMEWLRWSESPEGRMMWYGIDSLYLEQGQPGRADSERKLYETVLKSGDTYYISEPFCDLLEKAAFTLPDTTLAKEEVPSPIGFAYFARPVRLPKPDKGVMPYTYAIGWANVPDDKRPANWPPLIAMTYATKPPDAPESFCFWPLTYFGVGFDESINQRIIDFEHGSGQVNADWRYTDPMHGHEIQYLVALFRMMNQRLVSTRKMPVHRSTRRRLERIDYPIRDHVQVVVLRRLEQKHETYEEHGETGKLVEWRWRWMVSGHWRDQWYPSKNRWIRIWILPYMKGPDDKPVKDDQRKVYTLIR